MRAQHLGQLAGHQPERAALHDLARRGILGQRVVKRDLFGAQAQRLVLPLRLAQVPRQVDQTGDHLRCRDGLVGVAQQGVFQRLAEFKAAHQVAALGAADPIVQQLAQRLQGQILLLQRGDTLQELIAQDVQPRLVEAGHREEVDHLVRIHRSADHLSHRGIDVPLPGATVRTLAVVRPCCSQVSPSKTMDLIKLLRCRAVAGRQCVRLRRASDLIHQ